MLLFGLETLVLTPLMGRALGVFQQTAKETRGGGLVISTSDGRNGGGRIHGDQGLHPKEAEHGHAIYCDATYCGPLQEVGAEVRRLGFSQVVGIGRA